MKSKETRLLTLSGQTAPAATDPHSQGFFFFLSFASSASFTQTLQTCFSRSLLTGSRQSEMLSAPPPLSLSQPTFNPNLKTQLRSALSPSANVHRATRHTATPSPVGSPLRPSARPVPQLPGSLLRSQALSVPRVSTRWKLTPPASLIWNIDEAPPPPPPVYRACPLCSFNLFCPSADRRCCR